MGEAKRRKSEIEQLKRTTDEWLASLSTLEREIASVSLLAHQRIVLDRRFVAGCYLLAFFLKEYLKREKDITVDLVVGYVNDGTSPIMASHAWIEHDGRKTDISLTLTENVEMQPPGELRILDRIVRRGRVSYTYHRVQSADALVCVESLAKEHPEMAGLLHAKAEEHRYVEAMSKTPQGIRQFLDAAPSDRNYAALAAQLSLPKITPG